MFKVKEFIKNNEVSFECYSKSNLYYSIENWDDEGNYFKYEFPVPIYDLEGCTIYGKDQAELFEKWIRKAIYNNEFRIINQKIKDTKEEKK